MLVTQLCLTLCDPTDCSLPGSYVHGILQARILKCTKETISKVKRPPSDWEKIIANEAPKD